MRLNKFLSTVTIITLFSVLYVYQQSEVFRLAYVGQKKQSVFQDSLDKNSVLRYNINQNTSLVYIGNKVLSNTDFQMPDNYRLVRMALSGEAIATSRTQGGRENMLSRIFGIKRQAEARTINP